MLDLEKIQKMFPHLSLKEISERYDKDITSIRITERQPYRDYPRPPPAQGELLGILETKKLASK